jgi:hypothetical protein
MFMNSKVRSITAASLVALALTACSEASTGPAAVGGGVAALNQIVTSSPLNASSADTLVYFSFATNTLVPKTAAWDIALRRFELRVNGGVAGSGGVTGYNFENTKTATPAQVLAFTNLNTLAAFDSIRDARIPADSLFKADRLISNATGFLSFGAAAPTPNTANFWKVRTATGAYELTRVTAITFAGRALSSVTFESRTQTGVTLSTARSFTIATGASPVNVNLAGGNVVAPSGCNWDLVITPALYEIGVNAACNVGTYPGDPTPAFAGTTSASDAPQYAGFLSLLTGPIPNDIENPAGPFRYNLNNDQRLSPSFNTFLIRNGSATYKLQVIGYYGVSGAGGFPTLRYARIR